MNNRLRCMLLGMTVALIGAGSATAADPTARPGQLDGRRLYREYCSSCHGVSGQADGPDAAMFVARPRNLREGFLKKYPADELVRRVREGKPLELALDLPSLRVRAGEAEAVVTYMKRLPRIDWSVAGVGQDTFQDRCVECHGVLGQPPPTLPVGVRRPRDLSDPAYQRSVSDKELILTVRHGREGMPGLMPRVSEQDAVALAAYVRLLSPGYELYSKYCAACHGDDGRGNGDLSDAFHEPTVAFDREYFVHADPEQLRAHVWHMVRDEKPIMPHFRVLLSEDQARAIVEYLQRTD